MTNEDKIKKWLAGELSDSERKQFESTDEFAKIDRLMNAVKKFRAPEYDVEVELGNFTDNVIHKTKKISLYKRISSVLRIAAIFILALTIGYFTYTNFNSFSGKGWIAEQGVIYLPDSSSVILNAKSKIRFSEKSWKNERNVELNGEAFFKVKKGSQFTVKTQHGAVTVLGTEFGVKDWENYYEVTCYSGLVKVIAKQNSVLLKPNSAFRIVNGNEERYNISNKTEPDWLNGESSFSSVPYGFVINELERQYKVSVETNNVDLNQLFSGGFSHNKLEIALKSITIPVNLYYEINGNQIVITIESK